MSYAQIGSLGPEWQFEGVGDYAGDGKTGFLTWDTSQSSPSYGTIVIGEDVAGSAQYIPVGGLDPSVWQFEGSGDFLGHGQADFLIWDGKSSDPNYGALVVGEVVNRTTQYTQIGSIGPEWNLLGVGDYDGRSPSEFLMRNENSGVLAIGTVSGGTAGYTPVGGVGPEWNFHATRIAPLT